MNKFYSRTRENAAKRTGFLFNKKGLNMPEPVSLSDAQQTLEMLAEKVRALVPEGSRSWVSAAETWEGEWTVDFVEPSEKFGSIRIQFWTCAEGVPELCAWSVNIPNWIAKKVVPPVPTESLDVDIEYTDFYADELSLDEVLEYFKRCVEEYLS